MLPRHGAQRGLVQREEGGDRKIPSGELPYERLAPKGRIPTAVDWRGTGADGVVKDQVRCCCCCRVSWQAHAQQLLVAATAAGRMFAGAAYHAQPGRRRTAAVMGRMQM